MLRKLRPHLLLSLIFWILTLGQQYLFYLLKGLPIIPLSLGKYLGIYLFLLFFTFAKNKAWRWSMLSFVLILNLFQMGHLSYFGTQVLPTEIYLFFMESNEIGGTLQAELIHILIPLLFTAIPLTLGWFANKKLSPTYQWKFIPILFCLYFAYNPVRTYLTGNTWGRQPSTRELSGMNIYLSLSYFLGKILPHKMNKSVSEGSNSSLSLILTKEKTSSWDNIIIVLGESLTPNHMQLYGYPKETTPFLVSQKDSPQFTFQKALANGVSTDITVAFFLNIGFGDAGGRIAAKGEHCLYKLAKNNGFTTSFYSIQSEQQLRYIAPYLCSAYLDTYKSLEDIAPQTHDHNSALDIDLLPPLQKLLGKDQKNFVILHQRGSHAPWSQRFRKEIAKFKSAEGDDTRVNDYDNSVVEFDLFWEGLVKILSKLPGKNLVIYLSDHGEGLGETGRWGHGTLTPVSFEVPLLIQSFNADLPNGAKELPKNIPQYNISLFVAQALGYKSNQDFRYPPSDYVIYGNDIDGFSGKAEVQFQGDEYFFKAVP